MNWIYANWNVISPFLALILPFFVKLPFIAHSTILEFFLKIFMKVILPSGSSNNTPVPPPDSSGDAQLPDPAGQVGSAFRNPKI